MNKDKNNQKKNKPYLLQSQNFTELENMKSHCTKIKRNIRRYDKRLRNLLKSTAIDSKFDRKQ